MTISLNKRVEAVGIKLAKAGITTVPPVRVGLALDVSGSAEWLYKRGIMQETVNRIQAVALKFDDNGELDMWTFCDRFNRIDTATAADYDGYVTRAIMENRKIALWGGTEYGPVLNDMINFWFPRSAAPTVAPAQKSGGFFGGLFKKTEAVPAPTVANSVASPLPAMGLLVTDGANADRRYAAEVLTDAARHNIYWNMVGVGDSSLFTFLQEQADWLPNVGFVNLSSLEMSDDELYDQIINPEFVGWLKKITP